MKDISISSPEVKELDNVTFSQGSENIYKNSEIEIPR